MSLSRKCDECWQVKRVSAYPVESDSAQSILGRLVYLCRPCARILGYRARQEAAR